MNKKNSFFSIALIFLSLSCSEKQNNETTNKENNKTESFKNKENNKKIVSNPKTTGKQNNFYEEIILSSDSGEIFFFDPLKKVLKDNLHNKLVSYRENIYFKDSFKLSEQVFFPSEIFIKSPIDGGPPAQTDNESGLKIWPPDVYANSISIIKVKSSTYTIFPVVEDPDYRYVLINSFTDKKASIYLYWAKLRYNINISKPQRGNYLTKFTDGKIETVFLKTTKIFDSIILNDKVLFLTLRGEMMHLESFFGKKFRKNLRIKTAEYEKPAICGKKLPFFIHSLKKCDKKQCLSSYTVSFNNSMNPIVKLEGSLVIPEKAHPHASFIKNISSNSCNSALIRSTSILKYNYFLYRTSLQGSFSTRVHHFSSYAPVYIFSKAENQISVFQKTGEGLWKTSDLDF
ncbi:hypothetical protein KKF34_10625 [Myxococcota bacterium]|nr:hypothetical protein [Myxococcota bacterium]MBU1380171.1 hypothetical protein [Myxococcota bacterium]MBU1497321.1 hypothetical protein [Myxococcota bacterium]